MLLYKAMILYVGSQIIAYVSVVKNKHSTRGPLSLGAPRLCLPCLPSRDAAGVYWCYTGHYIGSTGKTTYDWVPKSPVCDNWSESY